MELLNQIEKDDYSGIENFIESLFETDVNESLAILKNTYSEVEEQKYSRSKSFLLNVLESFWNLFQAYISILNESKQHESLSQIKSAREGFLDVDLELLAHRTRILEEIYTGIIEIKTLNVYSGFEKINSARKSFDTSNKFFRFFEDGIDAIESDTSFQAGIALFYQLDYENGQIAIERAANILKKLSLKKKKSINIDQDATANYSYLMGVSFQYQAIAAFFEQMRRFRLLEFDHFNYAENEALEYSLKAIKFLSTVVDYNEYSKNILKNSKAISLLTQVIFGIGQNFSFLLDPSNGKSVFSVVELKKLVKNARKTMIETGETGIFLIRYCSEFETQLRNYEKWAKISGTVNKVVESHVINEKNIKETTRVFIKNGDIEKALEYLIENAVQYELTNDAILLYNRFNSMRKKIINGLLSNEQIHLLEAEISRSIIELIEFKLEN